ncbi:MAG: hypothetical protein HQ582_27290 [Planctomycetes bacterium]|nr:hypothetical protein [Planctomycetota bacterium]
MTRKQYAGALAVLIVAGLAGGAAVSWLAGGRAWAAGVANNPKHISAEVVTTQHLRVVDATGNLVAMIGTRGKDKQEPFLSMLSDGKRILSMGRHTRSTFLDISPKQKGQPRITLALQDVGVAGVILADGNLRTRVGLMMNVAGDGTVRVYDEKGKTTWEAQ